MPGKYVHLSLTRGTSAACGARNVQSSDGNIDMVDCPRCKVAHEKATAEKPTIVVFRKWNDTGDVIALFPEIPSDLYGDHCQSYEHVGQHGGADTRIVYGATKPATPAEYAELKEELENLSDPYTLAVRQKVLYAYSEARRKEARRTRLIAEKPVKQQQRRAYVTQRQTVIKTAVAKNQQDAPVGTLIVVPISKQIRKTRLRRRM